MLYVNETGMFKIIGAYNVHTCMFFKSMFKRFHSY